MTVRFHSFSARGLRAVSLGFLVSLVFLLSGCGTLVDMGGNSKTTTQRRVYVNDVARNDSLPSTLLNGGVYFVMQPGKQYTLRLEGAVAGDYLQVLAASGNVYTFWKNVQGNGLSGTTQTFTMRDSLSATANYYLAFLRSSIGGNGTKPTKVRLVPTNPGLPDTMKVRLVFVRTLPGLADSTSKKSFAHAFLSELTTTYAAYGIILDTSYEIVEPDQPAFTVDFSKATTFPGVARTARIANTVYLYLVNNITNRGDKSADGTILGFAPREAIDFVNSEVVLSVETGANPVNIAITTAHEMGHFIGLRHTTSTALDQSGDDDLSNTTDGFVGTDSCAGLTKRMATSPQLQTIQMSQGRPYCLRIAVDHCPSYCGDRVNLMFPYQCLDVTQKTLVPEQTTFLRQNLSLFRH